MENIRNVLQKLKRRGHLGDAEVVLVGKIVLNRILKKEA
jgi:hypothetical protein